MPIAAQLRREVNSKIMPQEKEWKSRALEIHTFSLNAARAQKEIPDICVVESLIAAIGNTYGTLVADFVHYAQNGQQNDIGIRACVAAIRMHLEHIAHTMKFDLDTACVEQIEAADRIMIATEKGKPNA